MDVPVFSDDRLSKTLPPSGLRGGGELDLSQIEIELENVNVRTVVASGWGQIKMTRTQLDC